MKTAHTISIFIPIILSAITTAAYQRTTRPRLKPSITDTTTTVIPDTTIEYRAADSTLLLSGYEKPIQSSRESMFVTNHTNSPVTAIEIDLEYLDTHSRQLHKRTVTVRCEIPAGETRRIEFPAWDTQKAFYYRLSVKPRQTYGTPYDIRCRIINYSTPSKKHD